MAELRCTSEVVYATLVELRRIRVDSSQQQVINSMVSHDGKLAGVNVDRIFLRVHTMAITVATSPARERMTTTRAASPTSR